MRFPDRCELDGIDWLTLREGQDHADQLTEKPTCRGERPLQVWRSVSCIELRRSYR